ncbi:OmcA/MtrC family decaheme c-type cytochrome [Shewanella gelidii]|nr:OmcA/MtrC family decaheme c-type cytochrome [Shewanella gelidii]MCL1097429.1 OmcA/MtrC family decaheme c-type cytochrome [Shewanella gelidii]
MNNNSKKSIMLIASAITLALTGCGGSDGSSGEPGNPGGPAAEAIETLHLKVTKVTYTDGSPSIEIYATNQNDEPIVGIQDFGVKAAQLYPMGTTGAGNSAQWQTISIRSNPAVIVDNKNGSYTATVPVENLNQDLTQRFNVYAGGPDATLLDGVTSLPRREIVADYDGEGYAAKYTKNVVSHQVCAKCHTEGEALTRRHGSYQTHETCATCHNGSFNEDTQWNHLVHNIHNANKSFTDKYDNEYTGEAAEALLQNNCQSCHVESETLTEWANYTRVPTMETCTSCHTNIDFKAGEGHSQQDNNANCIACHNSQWTAEIHSEQALAKKAVIDQLGLSASLVGNSDDTATLTISLLDANSQAVDINSMLSKIQRVEATTNVGPNFPQLGYRGKDSLNLVENGILQDGASIVDGNLVRITPALPFGDGDTDTAFSFIGFSVCVEGATIIDCAPDGSSEYTGMKAELAFGTKSGNAASMRHIDSVNFASCENCHGDTFDIHKGSHHPGFVMTEQLGREINGEIVVGIDGCVSCHTPDGTYAGGVNKGAIEMKLHRTHIEDAFALVGGDCKQCHNDLNLDAFKVKGALATAGGLYTTPVTATCTSCHTIGSPYMVHSKEFLEANGAVVDGDKDTANQAVTSESCLFCHKPTVDDHTKLN